jgi:hypothetical protein
MDMTRIGSAFGAAVETSRHNARLRAAEKNVARACALWHRATRKECARPSWAQRINASIDPVIACAASAMLGWLLHKWL